MGEDLDLVIHPLLADRWPDFERLFGKNGACGGCWCMWYFQSNKEYEQMKGEGSRNAMRAKVESGAVPGLLGYADGAPVGWCALGPRSSYPRLGRMRIFAAVDEQPVWSVVCFFVARPFRRRGVTRKLLIAALAYAREHGAMIVEAYPVDKEKATDIYAYTGLASTFRALGFTEVARRSPSRPIMRYTL